ncbi:MAG: nucleotidyltransferase [Verrucomicrobiae bacterium]|nr:nucleotidyltransferase [Verrucomicrobiae bacterium]
MNIDPKRKQFSEILNLLAEELDISPTKRMDAAEKYRAVSDWLAAKEGSCLERYKPEIYPHGSFRLGTVVRPLGRDEFDLDFTCELQINNSARPDQVKGLVGQRLLENGRYEGIATPLNRCWRINYAGDFHMDIMPGIPDVDHELGNILVSDRKLASWIRSNPSGYARWFDEVMKPIRETIRFEVKASVEALPDDKIKTPLQVAIQILKRHRDLRFQHDLDNRPGSIILTTLAAKAYNQEEDLFSAILAIATGMPDKIEQDGEGHPVVLNPANLSENLAEKWKEHPERLTKFKSWLADVRTDLHALLSKGDLPSIAELLEDRFGTSESKAAIRKHGEQLNESHRLGNVVFGTGTIAVGSPSIATPVRRNRFYGA